MLTTTGGEAATSLLRTSSGRECAAQEVREVAAAPAAKGKYDIHGRSATAPEKRKKRWKSNELAVRKTPWRFDLRQRSKRSLTRRVDDVLDDGSALDEVIRDTHTTTARKSITARVEWWCARAKARGFEPFPIDAEKLRLAAAILKSGRYKTAEQYLYSMKKQNCQEGYEWSEQLSALLADLRRSCKRGMGPTAQAEPLVWGTVPSGYHHKVIQDLKEAVIVGSAWLLREIELAALQTGDIEHKPSEGCGEATITVWSSKTDTQAVGVKRSLQCSCPMERCPVKAVMKLKMGKAPRHHLIRTREGGAVPKQIFVEALKELARTMGTTNTERITRHSMRVTGAQDMLKAGVDLEQFKLFGRWKSSAQMFR